MTFDNSKLKVRASREYSELMTYRAIVVQNIFGSEDYKNLSMSDRGLANTLIACWRSEAWPAMYESEMIAQLTTKSGRRALCGGRDLKIRNRRSMMPCGCRGGSVWRVRYCYNTTQSCEVVTEPFERFTIQYLGERQRCDGVADQSSCPGRYRGMYYGVSSEEAITNLAFKFRGARYRPGEMMSPANYSRLAFLAAVPDGNNSFSILSHQLGIPLRATRTKVGWAADPGFGAIMKLQFDIISETIRGMAGRKTEATRADSETEDGFDILATFG